ncbi:42180_t:CDS:2 [Gigaspora margarita]|uniref:42180_t:CDS:1 n=1 Tax=Gigaspora margarita TaxID=4874 RepID=A0ABM8W4T3_GIGMA|nr:42180_t:CDS:2 [Gigaspora margarita]
MHAWIFSRKKKDQATHQEAIQTALQALEKSKNPNRIKKNNAN